MQSKISPQKSSPELEAKRRARRRFQAQNRLTSLRLSGSVLRVASLILDEADRDGRFRRSQAAICAGLSLSRATVVRAFAVLRSLGFIRVVYCGRHNVPICFVQFADWIKGGVSRLLAPVLKGFRRLTSRRVLNPEHGHLVDRKQEGSLTKGKAAMPLFRSMTDDLGPLRGEDFIPYASGVAKESFW